MARSVRHHEPGSSYHVMLRGNDGQDIFSSDADRCNMCLLMQEGVEKFGHRIHAFCFMRNHIHLLVQVGDVPLSKIIHNLAFRYTQGFNRKYSRRGHLFQGRFKSILIQESVYFERLLRYIHMNPIRANIVSNPEMYPWSGHNAYLGLSEFTWLTTSYGLSKFGKFTEEACREYRAYVQKIESENELEELRGGFKEGHILGDDDFLDKIRGKIDEQEVNLSLEQIIEVVSKAFEIGKEVICSSNQSRKVSTARGVITFLAKEEGKITLEEISVCLKKDSSTLSSLLSRFHKRHQRCSKLQNLVQEIKEKVVKLADLQA